MAGFYYRGNLKGQESAVIHRTIAASETVTIGDAVKNSSGFVAVCDANDTPVLGIVVGFAVRNNNSQGWLPLANAPSSYYDGTFTDGGVGVGTYVATSDNHTDKQVAAIVNVDPYAVWLNDADGDLADADVLSFFSLVDEDQIDDSTNSTTVGEFQLLERDPEADPASANVSKGLFHISVPGLFSFEPEG